MNLQFVSESGEILATMDMERRDQSRPFRTGSLGYYAGGPVVIDGVKFQASMSLVELYSADADRAKVAAQIAADKKAQREARSALRR